MNRDAVVWRGYWVAAPTTFGTDMSFDEQAFRALLRLYLSQGVHGLLINGTTGEWFAQSPGERRLVAEIAVDEVAGRIPVVVGCSSYTPAETIGLADHARSTGAAGAVSTPPPYVHPNDDEIISFFRTVSDTVDIPWMVYNWPRGTGVDISVRTLARLAELDRIVAIKDSTGDELKCAEACEATSNQICFFGRFIHRRGMALWREFGGAGNIDGGGLGAPFAVPYFEALWQGDLPTALQLGARYSTLTAEIVNPDYSGKFASPTAQLKAAMNLLGQPGTHVRPPLLDIEDPDTLRHLSEALRRAGLLEAVA